MKKAFVLSLVLIAFTANLNAFTDAEIHQEAHKLLKAVNENAKIEGATEFLSINGLVCRYNNNTLIRMVNTYGISIIDLVKKALNKDPDLFKKINSDNRVNLYADYAPPC